MRCCLDRALINTFDVNFILVLDERPRDILAACVGNCIRGLVHGCKRFLLRAVLQLRNRFPRLCQYSGQVLLDLCLFALPRGALRSKRDGGCLQFFAEAIAEYADGIVQQLQDTLARLLILLPFLLL